MKRLRELRKGRHLTQQQLADILNVSQQSIHKYETGICSPTIDGLCDMAEFFDTSIDYLLGTTNIPYRYDRVTDGELRYSEKRLLNCYRSLTPATQTLIQRVMDDYFPEKGNHN